MCAPCRNHSAPSDGASASARGREREREERRTALRPRREASLAHAIVASRLSDGLRMWSGEVVAGRIPGREHPDERIFWNPFGLAIEDIAVASAIYEEALLKGLGQPLQLVDQEWDVLF
jgi:ornithine cyclodeaminase/alanine dehydrogenase-like protein (mu-crystallin family)